MIDYKVIIEDELNALEEKVADMMKDGWRPSGGVSVSIRDVKWENERKGYTETETVRIFSQAMTYN